MAIRALGVISRESVHPKNPDQIQKYINDMAIDLSVGTYYILFIIIIFNYY